MSNQVQYAEKFSSELIETLIQETLTSPFITSNVKFLDAKTFHFKFLNVSGYKDHSRAGGWNRGEFVETDHPYTLEHDRDVEFLVDEADRDESGNTATVQNISLTFEREQSAPETDAYFFSKIAQTALDLDGYNSETAEADWTAANVFSKLKSMIGAGKLRRYKAKGALICYVRSFIMDLLEQSTSFTRKIEMTQIAEGGTGLETRVTDIDGVTIMEVIDDERFYDKFDFTEGFMPVAKTDDIAGSRKLNVLIASPLTAKTVKKIASIYYFEKGTHTVGDGDLYQNRSLSDTFVFPNGKDGQIDSVYVDVDTTEYEAE